MVRLARSFLHFFPTPRQDEFKSIGAQEEQFEQKEEHGPQVQDNFLSLPEVQSGEGFPSGSGENHEGSKFDALCLTRQILHDILSVQYGP